MTDQEIINIAIDRFESGKSKKTRRFNRILFSTLIQYGFKGSVKGSFNWIKLSLKIKAAKGYFGWATAIIGQDHEMSKYTLRKLKNV